jgi:hypothetical protein
MTFGILILIFLDRYDIHNRTGSGLIFILMTFSYLNLRKVVNRGIDPLE